MPIPAPPIAWPQTLREEGPEADPTILLGADAAVGGSPFRVRALRVRRGHRGPDYRDGIPASAYQDALDGLLDDIEDLVDSIEPESVTIGGADYLLWMAPVGRD